MGNTASENRSHDWELIEKKRQWYGNLDVEDHAEASREKKLKEVRKACVGIGSEVEAEADF